MKQFTNTSYYLQDCIDYVKTLPDDFSELLITDAFIYFDYDYKSDEMTHYNVGNDHLTLVKSGHMTTEPNVSILQISEDTYIDKQCLILFLEQELDSYIIEEERQQEAFDAILSTHLKEKYKF